jgi:DNA modification methylase
MTVVMHTGDCRDVLKTLAANSVHCVCTSPPYWALRSYLPDDHKDKKLELGIEETPGEHVANIVEVFREVRRVLRPDGTCWVNYGDSYAATGKSGGGVQGERWEFAGADYTGPLGGKWRPAPNGLKPKDLVGMPWRIAFALQADGWWLRSDIIWAKPNPMPESVTDRPTKAHEYVFLLTKSARYFYDAAAVRENFSDARMGNPGCPSPKAAMIPGQSPHTFGTKVWDRGADLGGRNLRSVWTIATAPFSEAHFATFPPKLAETCIKAGTSEKGCCPECGAPWVRVVDVTYSDAHRGMVGNQSKIISDDRVMHIGRESDKRMNKNVNTTGFRQSCACSPDAPVPCTVLDPFAGAGTTLMVADRLQRNAIGIELSPAYASMAEKRLADDQGSLLSWWSTAT